MARVIEELLRDGGVTETADGYQDVRFFLVGDLSPRIGVRYQALLASGVPRIADPHPDIPGIVVTSRSSASASGSSGKCVVRVEYGSPEDATPAEDLDRTAEFGPVTWSGFVRSETLTTFRDVHGDPLLVTYQGTPVLDVIASATGSVVSTDSSFGFLRTAFVVEAELERPLQTLQATRWERDLPERRQALYQGHVNASTWRGYAPHKVLVREVGFDEDPQGGYRARYVFVVSPLEHGWKFEAPMTIATELGPQIPQDATIGRGIGLFDVFPAANLNTLNLS